MRLVSRLCDDRECSGKPQDTCKLLERSIVRIGYLKQRLTLWLGAGEDSAGATVATGVTPLDERTKSLPLLYLNSFNMSLDEIAESRSELANKATHALSLAAPLPAVGLAQRF